MKEITITANDAGRRLDRFLRKYLREASLGEIYKFIRKDVKVDGRRRPESYILNEGEVLSLYISDEEFEKLIGPQKMSGGGSFKRNFDLVCEDDEILIANKPYGLLTHGDAKEKKDHLANRVKDYLIASGAYNPREEKVFTPAPVNRLDRNTTGIVIFGKTSESMRELTRMIRDGEVRKFYLTIACGIIEDVLHLHGSLEKDEVANKVEVNLMPDAQDEGKIIETIVTPLEYMEFGNGYTATLCMVELVTGRSHQIRAHLAAAGHPLIGDGKYALGEYSALNEYCRHEAGLTTQLLHAYRVEFAGRSFKSPMPPRFAEIFWKLYG